MRLISKSIKELKLFICLVILIYSCNNKMDNLKIDSIDYEFKTIRCGIYQNPSILLNFDIKYKSLLYQEKLLMKVKNKRILLDNIIYEVGDTIFLSKIKNDSNFITYELKNCNGSDFLEMNRIYSELFKDSLFLINTNKMLIDKDRIFYVYNGIRYKFEDSLIQQEGLFNIDKSIVYPPY